MCSSFAVSNSLDVPLTTGSGQKNTQNMISDSRKASRGLECNATNEVNLISQHEQFYRDLVNRSQQVLAR